MTDDERMATLLDGRLDAREREDALARIADSDDDYVVFADAAAILREHEAQGTAAPKAEPASARVIPLRRRPMWARPTAAWAALAAVLVALALIPVLRSRMGNPYDPARLASRVGGGATRLPAGWMDARPWSTRGAGEKLSDEAAGARAGALLVDLELAVRSRDIAATTELAGRVRGLLDEENGAGAIATLYDSIAKRAGEPPEQLAGLLKDGRENARSYVSEPYLDAGAWTEAARLAVQARDRHFFARRASLDEIARIVALPALTERGRAAAERVRATMATERAPEWNVLAADLDVLLGVLGR